MWVVLLPTATSFVHSMPHISAFMFDELNWHSYPYSDTIWNPLPDLKGTAEYCPEVYLSDVILRSLSVSFHRPHRSSNSNRLDLLISRTMAQSWPGASIDPPSLTLECALSIGSLNWSLLSLPLFSSQKTYYFSLGLAHRGRFWTVYLTKGAIWSLKLYNTTIIYNFKLGSNGWIFAQLPRFPELLDWTDETLRTVVVFWYVLQWL